MPGLPRLGRVTPFLARNSVTECPLPCYAKFPVHDLKQLTAKLSNSVAYHQKPCLLSAGSQFFEECMLLFILKKNQA